MLTDSIFRPARSMIAICATLVLLGRAYSYFFWGSPIRVLVWDENLFSPVIRLFGSDWESFANNLAVDRWLNVFSKSLGVFFAFSGVLALIASRRWRPWFRWPLLLAAGIMFCHALLEMKDYFYHGAQVFEHAIQIVTPVLLVMAAVGISAGKVSMTAKMAIACTFAAHGLYAIGYYAVPAKFIEMTLALLPLSESGARQFLWWAGLSDLLVAVALFLPAAARYALIYATVWGLLTALARVASGFHGEFPGMSLHAYLYQTVFRLPHGLLPLTTLLLLRALTRVPTKGARNTDPPTSHA